MPEVQSRTCLEVSVPDALAVVGAGADGVDRLTPRPRDTDWSATGLGLLSWQPRPQDPHEVRRRFGAQLGPRVCQVVRRWRIQRSGTLVSFRGPLRRPPTRYAIPVGHDPRTHP
jgi:hypothetical protein